MAVRSEVVVTVCYTLALYNFLLAAGAAVLGGSPWPTVFGALAGIFWIIAGLVQYHE